MPKSTTAILHTKESASHTKEANSLIKLADTILKNNSLTKKQKSAEIKKISNEIRKLVGKKKRSGKSKSESQSKSPDSSLAIQLHDYDRPKGKSLDPSLINSFQNRAFPINLPNKVPTIVPVPSSINAIAMEAMNRKIEAKDAALAAQKQKYELIQKTQEEQQKLQRQIDDLKHLKSNVGQSATSTIDEESSKLKKETEEDINELREDITVAAESIKDLHQKRRVAEETGDHDEMRRIDVLLNELTTKIPKMEAQLGRIVSLGAVAQLKSLEEDLTTHDDGMQALLTPLIDAFKSAERKMKISKFTDIYHMMQEIYAVTMSERPPEQRDEANELLRTYPVRGDGTPIVTLTSPLLKRWIENSNRFIKELPAIEGRGLKKKKFRHRGGNDGLAEPPKEETKPFRLNVFAEKLPEYAPKPLRDLVQKWGDAKIVKLRVCRVPIYKTITTLANLLSLGKMNAKRKELNYDNFFHLYLDMYLKKSTGESILVSLEKNEKIDVNYDVQGQTRQGGQCVNINTSGNTTLLEALAKTEHDVGANRMYVYDLKDKNCQVFVTDVLRSNGWLTKSIEEFAMQDANQLLPSYLLTMARGATGLANRIRSFFFGKGSKHKMVKYGGIEIFPLPDTSEDPDARKQRIIAGLPASTS